MANVTTENRVKKIKRIPLSRLKLNEFDLHEKKRGIKVFQRSIREMGLLDPITVIPEGNQYVVIDGIRRLLAWEKLYPDLPISCNILESSSATETQTAPSENDAEQTKLDAYALNLARAKVPTTKMEAMVWEMHERGKGYETIANCFGYKKSGIQKMIHRLKEKKGMLSLPVPAKKQTISNIRNVRKRLQNLAKELNVDNDADKKLFLDIEDWLKAQEDLMQDEMASETASEQDNTVDADTAEDQPQQT